MYRPGKLNDKIPGFQGSVGALLPNLNCFCLINPTSHPNTQRMRYLFIMYFVIAPNVNKMWIHTDQLMMLKHTFVVYFWELAMSHWLLT